MHLLEVVICKKAVSKDGVRRVGSVPDHCLFTYKLHRLFGERENSSTLTLSDNVGEPSAKKKGPFKNIVAALHAEFDYHPALNELTLR